MPVHLRDLIDLPDHVRQGDFVLRLSEGITRPDETVRNYVVTPQLVRCFGEALDLIRSAVQGGSSKGAYLHGSFGSGKSHFMAILLLLLEAYPAARAIPELAEAVRSLRAWADGKRFLLVPYHLIGARDLTSAILGGYVDHVLRQHPDASMPGVFRADRILANARELRTAMGDDRFFERLNGGDDGAAVGAPAPDDGWGTLGGDWDARSFEAAATAGPRDERRAHLVGDIVERLLSAARGSSEYVDLDEGLSIISRHAKSLGYDGLILFLDELILWLSSHAADIAFINQEGQKLAKLVEAQSADRPAPIISFIARQRDLRELVGETMLGVQQVALSESLSHWDQRFAIIKLEDRNLPAIAQRRVLKPKSESAKQQIDEAFRETEKIRREVMQVLLTSHGTPVDFRAIYPFSPALMETLVALSALLQRERTALKLMFQLLVEQRDTLRLGEIVPVGDLFDAIMTGQEPFSDAMKVHAECAKKLYDQKLLPLIEHEAGMTKEEVSALPTTDPRVAVFRRDDRLAKTLLLSALAPEVESFRGMTVGKLAALNHGSIRTPVPGREGQIVFDRVRKWAADIGQIRLGDETVNPSVTVQLTGVDTESILQQAASEDNSGNRIRKIKELLFEKLGIEDEALLPIQHGFEWRATKRICEILFTNVRELGDESLRNPGERWRLVIDYPFDSDRAHSPRSDLARIERFRQANPGGARTIVWLPSFFSNLAQNDLGRLVVLDHVLTGPRFDGYASRLSAIDRAQARSILDNQRSTLRVRVSEYLDQAYGVRPGSAGILDTTHQLELEDQVQSLHADVVIRPPAAANLSQAIQALLDQAMVGQFPGHPEFDSETKLSKAALVRVWGELQKALAAPDGRTMVETTLRRDVRSVVTSLRLAQMSEAHLAVEDYWCTHFERKLAQHPGEPASAANLRKWLDEPKPMGLPSEVQNLILIYVAARTNRAWFLHNNPYDGSIENLHDEAVLRDQPLPDSAVWETAVRRANGIFGLSASTLASAGNVAKLNAELKTAVDGLLEPMRALVKELGARMRAINIETSTASRWKAAHCGLGLLESIRAASDTGRVAALAAVSIEGTEVAVGTTVKQAIPVTAAIRDAQWRILESASKLPVGQALWKRAQDVLQHDELALALVPALRKIIDDAAQLLVEAAQPSQSSAPTPTSALPSPVDSSAGVGTSAHSSQATSTKSVEQVSRVLVWGDSDEAEVRAYYAGNPEGLARNRRLVQELKTLYQCSQVDADGLPAGLPKQPLVSVLEVHHIVPLSKGGSDERSNMIVVTPTLHALIHTDQACSIDLNRGSLRLFGHDLRIQVSPKHNG